MQEPHLRLALTHREEERGPKNRPSIVVWFLVLIPLFLAVTMIYSYSALPTAVECIYSTSFTPPIVPPPVQDDIKPEIGGERVLVIYSLFVDLNATINDPSLINLNFFVSTAVEEGPDVEYLFIMAANNVTEATTAFSNLTNPVWALAFPAHLRILPNVHLYWMVNGQYDLCNYANLLKTNWFKQNYLNFSKYFFLNGTVRGPLLHPTLYEKVRWLDLYFDRFNERPDVAAVGTMLSCKPKPHIQSYTIAMDRRGLEVANKTWFCPPKDVRTNVNTFTKWVGQTEVGFSTNIVSHNYTFLAIASEFLDMSGKEIIRSKTGTCSQEDPNFPERYHKWFPSPYDAIFFKSAGDVARFDRIPNQIKLELEVATAAVFKASARKKAKLSASK